MEGIWGMKAVSYTHLDVYKRQEYGGWKKKKLAEGTGFFTRCKEDGLSLIHISGKAKNQLTGRQKKKIRLVLLLLPFMIFVLIFNYAPLLGWSYAFVDFKPGVSVFDSEFVGLKYFQKIVANPKDFLNLMRNTLCISFLNICCSVLPAIFAIAISQLKNKRYAKMVQTGTSIPNFISWVLVYSCLLYTSCLPELRRDLPHCQHTA